jgi:hypothetical protein
VAGAVRRNPLAALGIGAVIALVAYQAGYLRRDRLRAAGQEVRRDATSRHWAFRATGSQPALIGIGRIARLGTAGDRV